MVVDGKNCLVAMHICEFCGFDEHDSDRLDAAGTVASLPFRWRWLVEGLDRKFLRETGPDHGSVADALTASARALGSARPANPPTRGVLAATGSTGWAGRDPDAAAAFDALQELCNAWHARLVHGDEPVPVEMLHATTHALSRAGRALAAAGAYEHARPDDPRAAKVAALFRSEGGVPKLPIGEAIVGTRGVEGDRQADRRHHGRPFQALCLWSSDVIEALQHEGHPIQPGRAGENATISGVRGRSLRPGIRLALGDVVVELTAYATPCAKNAAWFVDRDFRRMEHGLHPGDSRLYAAVLRPGRVTVGDPVVVEP